MTRSYFQNIMTMNEFYILFFSWGNTMWCSNLFSWKFIIKIPPPLHSWRLILVDSKKFHEIFGHWLRILEQLPGPIAKSNRCILYRIPCGKFRNPVMWSVHYCMGAAILELFLWLGLNNKSGIIKLIFLEYFWKIIYLPNRWF